MNGTAAPAPNRKCVECGMETNSLRALGGELTDLTPGHAAMCSECGAIHRVDLETLALRELTVGEAAQLANNRPAMREFRERNSKAHFARRTRTVATVN